MAEELPATRNVSWQIKFGEISASVGFIKKKFVYQIFGSAYLSSSPSSFGYLALED